MSWFEDLTGIVEHDPEHVRGQLELDGERLRSLANGQSWRPGRLEIPTLAELRKQVADLDSPGPGQLTLSERIADVRELHQDASLANAMFQVASQFNLLEMVHPGVCPEQGIGRYQSDRTQGPICAIACGAGTIFRNYLVEVDGTPGQTEQRQIDCLAGLGEALGNQGNRLWQMKNGYAMASEQGLRQIAEQLDGIDEPARDTLRQQLKIGIQWNTEVTLPGAGHTVSQAYCSALPVAYSREPSSLWEPFARLVLEASYDAVFCAARINQARTGSNQLFLTLIGGGAFGNRSEWITDAIEYAVDRHKASGLDVQIVSYGRSQLAIQALVDG
ncbi:MAG: hypothetical protein EA370_18115 [Wenzhouxiangella sp.]|nr:MAG: hypothetical protein EA370_18115 [Wenzhouxiangella sp.]